MGGVDAGILASKEQEEDMRGVLTAMRVIDEESALVEHVKSNINWSNMISGWSTLCSAVMLGAPVLTLMQAASIGQTSVMVLLSISAVWLAIAAPLQIAYYLNNGHSNEIKLFTLKTNRGQWQDEYWTSLMMEVIDHMLKMSVTLPRVLMLLRESLVGTPSKTEAIRRARSNLSVIDQVRLFRLAHQLRAMAMPNVAVDLSGDTDELLHRAVDSLQAVHPLPDAEVARILV